MSEILTAAPLRALDANGLPVAGARARFFLSGTSTPATTFQNVGLTVPHPPEIVANGSGIFPPVYTPTPELRMTVTDPEGVMLPGYPIDPAPTTQRVGAARTTSFEPTPEIAATNAQDAIEVVLASLAAPLLGAGLGVSGLAPTLGSFDTATTPSGFYRFTDATTGTRPGPWGESDTGTAWLVRETSESATMWASRRGTDELWGRRLVSGVWEAWRALSVLTTDGLVPSGAVDFATQGEAEAGSSTAKVMSPLRTAQGALQVVLDRRASQGEAEAGSSTDKLMTPALVRGVLEAAPVEMAAKTLLRPVMKGVTRRAWVAPASSAATVTLDARTMSGAHGINAHFGMRTYRIEHVAGGNAELFIIERVPSASTRALLFRFFTDDAAEVLSPNIVWPRHLIERSDLIVGTSGNGVSFNAAAGAGLYLRLVSPNDPGLWFADAHILGAP